MPRCNCPLGRICSCGTDLHEHEIKMLREAVQALMDVVETARSYGKGTVGDHIPTNQGGVVNCADAIAKGHVVLSMATRRTT